MFYLHSKDKNDERRHLQKDIESFKRKVSNPGTTKDNSWIFNGLKNLFYIRVYSIVMYLIDNNMDVTIKYQDVNKKWSEIVTNSCLPVSVKDILNADHLTDEELVRIREKIISMTDEYIKTLEP